MTTWNEIDRYREFVAKHPSGIADPDKDGLDAERRDVMMNRHHVEQIGQIVNMEKDYLSAPKLGPLAKAVYARIDRVRADMSTVGRRRDDILAEIEDQEYAHLRGKGAEKRKATANIKALKAEGEVLKKRYDELIAYQKNLVNWDLGLAVARDAGILAFDKKLSRHEEHDFKFTTRALGWAPSGYEVRDENNRVVARARTREAAYRASRRSNMAGSRVRSSASKKSHHLEFAGYEFTSGSGGTVIHHRNVDTSRPGDYGADPIGDGMFRMVPSGDIVDYDERMRRLPVRPR